MPLLNLADLERDALESLTTFATIPVSPRAFGRRVGPTRLYRPRDRTAFGLGTRAHIADFDVEIHRLEGRTPVLVVTVAATARATAPPCCTDTSTSSRPLGIGPKAFGPYERFAVTTVSSRVASATTATRPTRRYSPSSNGANDIPAQSLRRADRGQRRARAARTLEAYLDYLKTPLHRSN